MRLREKVALVTGGARGIGEGIARCLAEEGARVAIVDIDGAQAEKTAASLEGTHIGIAADVSQETEVAQAVARVVQELGGLDILVNNAGAGTGREDPGEISTPGLENVTQDSWDG